MKAAKYRPNSTQPLYQVARTELLKRLANGHYRPGSALPAERELSAEYGISIGTLRKAVDELVAEGILIRKQGRGTFVVSHDMDRLLYYFFHVVPFDGVKTEYPKVELIGFSDGFADAQTAQKLQLELGAPIFKIRNILSLGHQVLVVDDISLPGWRFDGLNETSLRERPSTLYHLYQEAFGLTVAHSSERLRAVAAPADIARLLELTTHAPALMIRRIALGYRNDPIEWRVSHIDTRAHEYFSELTG